MLLCCNVYVYGGCAFCVCFVWLLCNCNMFCRVMQALAHYFCDICRFVGYACIVGLYVIVGYALGVIVCVGEYCI